MICSLNKQVAFYLTNLTMHEMHDNETNFNYDLFIVKLKYNLHVQLFMIVAIFFRILNRHNCSIHFCPIIFVTVSTEYLICVYEY